MYKSISRQVGLKILNKVQGNLVFLVSNKIETRIKSSSINELTDA